MASPSVVLQSLEGDCVIARLPPTADVPAELQMDFSLKGFVSVTRTPQELSLVCRAECAPAGAEIDGRWTALYASGPIPFGLTGVVTSLVAPLSVVGCPVFVLSTFDGDIILVPVSNKDQAREWLVAAGHTVL